MTRMVRMDPNTGDSASAGNPESPDAPSGQAWECARMTLPPLPGPTALRVPALVSLAGETPTRGAGLSAPLRVMDNAVLLVRHGRVEEVRPWKGARLPAGCAVRDLGLELGDIRLMPACVNAHTHLQLSWLAGRTRQGCGFSAWLRSLVTLIGAPPPPAAVREAVEAACQSMARAGTRHVGDVGGSSPGALSAVADACARAGLVARHFCEWLGFRPPLADMETSQAAPMPQTGPSANPADAGAIWPPHCRAELTGPDQTRESLKKACAPAGHALYSTAPGILRAARAWCAAHKRIFSFHLAESPEETELLTSGTGPLRELYAGTVLPPEWSPPGLRPLACARSLGLLGPGVLAVHGVQLDAREVRELAASGTALCLCPRSNHALGVGLAPVRGLMESGARLCLGTDGLSSNADLDVRAEAVWLRETLDVPPQALVRMLTVNGAEALGLEPGAATLAQGQPAVFSVMPRELYC